MEKKGKTHAPSAVGAWLSRLPAPRFLYPLYLARQLYLDQRELELDSLPDALEKGSASAAMLVASHACSKDMPTEESLMEFIKEEKEKYGTVISKL